MLRKTLFVISLCGSMLLAGCEKDEGKLPNIAFKVASGYTSADASVNKGDAVKVGIQASKSESADVLKTFNVSASYDAASPTSLTTVTLSGTQGDNYETDVNLKARAQAGTEKYSFTVTNRDGLTNTVTLTLTVK